MGADSNEKKDYGSLESSSGFATDLGEKDSTASSTFMRGILSGDASKITQLLAPQISAAKTSAQQTNKTTAEMGTRSGGTAASASATNDKVHSDITSMIASLTGGAATSLGSQGAGLLSAGMEGSQAAFGDAKTMRDQTAAKWDDLIKSIASTATGVIGGLPGAPGGAADIASNLTGAVA
jgi:hypothetical protein